MSRQQVLQARSSAGQSAARTPDSADSSGELDRLAMQAFRYGWIGPQDAQRHLGIHSVSMLYHFIREWGLPYGRIGRRYRFRRVDLDQWVTSHRGTLSVVRSA